MTETGIAARVTRDPEILGGKLIIRGTRIPVDLIIDFLPNGESIDQILADCPELTAEDVEAAVVFSEIEASHTEVD